MHEFRRLAALVLVLAVSQCLAWSQTEGANHQPNPEAISPSTIQTAPNGKGYTLHVTTREVVIEVVARDRHDQPVNDLTENDFEIFEGPHKSEETVKQISGFRRIDPDKEQTNPNERLQSVLLPLGGRCELRSTIHYELAFHPGQWTSGYHTMFVTTNRRNIKLSYRNQYYVAVSDMETRRPIRYKTDADSYLLGAACFHSDVPPTLSLAANREQTHDLAGIDYTVKLLPVSLDAAGIHQDTGHVRLDYGVCSFSQSGRILGYWHFSEDRLLDAPSVTSTFRDGWLESIDVPRQEQPALVRFVVREPKTGNLGTVDLSTHARDWLIERNATDEPIRGVPKHILVSSEPLAQERRRGSLLGSTVPNPNALCGDVYELPRTTTLLPSDFRELNAVGAVYADHLNVAERILGHGIPGSTLRSEWFGIDYFGEFWVNKAGVYQFVLNADDGADLLIDNRIIINDDGIHPPTEKSASISLDVGRHTVRLPYFQGPTYVNLILQVKPPDGSLTIFDLKDFSRPPTEP